MGCNDYKYLCLFSFQFMEKQLNDNNWLTLWLYCFVLFENLESAVQHSQHVGALERDDRDKWPWCKYGKQLASLSLHTWKSVRSCDMCCETWMLKHPPHLHVKHIFMSGFFRTTECVSLRFISSISSPSSLLQLLMHSCPTVQKIHLHWSETLFFFSTNPVSTTISFL